MIADDCEHYCFNFCVGSIGYQGNGDTRTVEDGTHQYYQRSLSSDSSGPVPPMDHYSVSVP